MKATIIMAQGQPETPPKGLLFDSQDGKATLFGRTHIWQFLNNHWVMTPPFIKLWIMTSMHKKVNFPDLEDRCPDTVVKPRMVTASCLGAVNKK